VWVQALFSVKFCPWLSTLPQPIAKSAPILRLAAHESESYTEPSGGNWAWMIVPLPKFFVPCSKVMIGKSRYSNELQR
jgi:hypothetical protein